MTDPEEIAEAIAECRRKLGLPVTPPRVIFYDENDEVVFDSEWQQSESES